MELAETPTEDQSKQDASQCVDGHRWKSSCSMSYDTLTCTQCGMTLWSADSAETWEYPIGTLIETDEFTRLMEHIKEPTDDDPVEIRYDVDGETIDEIVAENAQIHWEMLNDDLAYLSISHDDGQKVRQFYVSGKDGKLAIRDSTADPAGNDPIGGKMPASPITIVEMGTPDDRSKMRCMSCGMEWTSSISSTGVNQHVNEHHFRVDVKSVNWRDRHKHFFSFPYDPQPCSECGADTISSETGSALECMCVTHTEQSDQAR